MHACTWNRHLCSTPQEVEAFAGAQQLVCERGRNEGRAQRVIQAVPAPPQRAGTLCGAQHSTSDRLRSHVIACITCSFSVLKGSQHSGCLLSNSVRSTTFGLTPGHR